ncbi:MAG: DUF4271 domain-containing protein [Bacteroidota bacterium]
MQLFKKILISTILFFVFGFGQVLAQSKDNPFAIKHRAKQGPKVEVIDDIVELPDANSAAETQNPFAIIRHPINQPKVGDTAVPTEQVEKKVEQADQAAGKVDDTNFRFGITLMLLIFLALISTIYRTQLTKAYRAFSNENVMRMLHREKGTVSYFPYYILYSGFVLNVGIFIYLLLRHYGILNGTSNAALLGYTLGGAAGLFFLKHTVLRFLGVVFPIAKETSFYNMTITMFGIVLSLVLFVANIVIAYAPTSLVQGFIYLTLILLVIIYFFRSIRGLSIAAKFLNRNKFHFFTYLCTVEIAPILILWKLATSGIGI